MTEPTAEELLTVRSVLQEPLQAGWPEWLCATSSSILLTVSCFHKMKDVVDLVGFLLGLLLVAFSAIMMLRKRRQEIRRRTAITIVKRWREKS